jgi:hypothetical protein
MRLLEQVSKPADDVLVAFLVTVANDFANVIKPKVDKLKINNKICVVCMLVSSKQVEHLRLLKKRQWRMRENICPSIRDRLPDMFENLGESELYDGPVEVDLVSNVLLHGFPALNFIAGIVHDTDTVMVAELDEPTCFLQVRRFSVVDDMGV